MVILTYKPDDRFIRLINMLDKQTVRPRRIIIINTEEKYFRLPDRIKESIPGTEVHHITPGEFNHGGTRNFGAGLSGAEYLIFMTQDAVPSDGLLIEELLKPMDNEKVAVSYARQLPSEKAGEIERYNRSFNYPDRDLLKTEKDIDRLGIKTIFCSDVCACYRRSVFDKLGGFVYTDFNEDMIFAFHAVKAGYGIYYASKAAVIHSHEYTALQQFKRNVVLGASQQKHPEVFKSFKSEGEGKKLVRGCTSYLMKKNKAYLIPVFYFHCAARYAGFLTGKYLLPLFSKRNT
ncbi:MAG: glycosyltransferase [Lachnospiraceae bacterium]|nr:glycosyltransferase [Lachnospiraceae bacterium]